ncbi:biliverdin-producing heme oxygenase [Rhizobium helianthi]|uniref:Biliverdin-producing heme oxygenase n=1 Tax=Rhizobium helianthi TaxID=1132695 RepID=A0ABW4M1P0_9HYPH
MRDLNVTAVHQHTNISEAFDLETLLGALYVLEGSSLGARILYVRAKELGLNEEFGARHLAGQAHSDGFRRFLEILDAAPNVDMNKVVEASRSAFGLAERAFQGNCECMMPRRSI